MARKFFEHSRNCDTVLTTAITSGWIPIVFQILEADMYFPRLPTRVDPHRSTEREFETARRFLSKLVDGEISDGKSDEINEHRKQSYTGLF